jgi:hypothetical protein
VDDVTPSDGKTFEQWWSSYFHMWKYGGDLKEALRHAWFASRDERFLSKPPEPEAAEPARREPRRATLRRVPPLQPDDARWLADQFLATAPDRRALGDSTTEALAATLHAYATLKVGVEPCDRGAL